MAYLHTNKYNYCVIRKLKHQKSRRVYMQMKKRHRNFVCDNDVSVFVGHCDQLFGWTRSSEFQWRHFQRPAQSRLLMRNLRTNCRLTNVFGWAHCVDSRCLECERGKHTKNTLVWYVLTFWRTRKANALLSSRTWWPKDDRKGDVNTQVDLDRHFGANCPQVGFIETRVVILFRHGIRTHLRIFVHLFRWPV